MSRDRKFQIILALVICVLLLVACDQIAQTGMGGVEIVQDFGFTIPKNSQGSTSEQQNIIDRLKVTTDPTKVMWIHLITLDGKIIMRMPVARKVTSSGKRLEPITACSDDSYSVPGYKAPNGIVYDTCELLQPDGTFGVSDNYIFWFDPMHRYHQWGTAGGLGYLLTDYPIDLRNPQDEISGMYNTDIAAYQWQKVQEAEICKSEGKTYNMDEGVCQ